MKMSKKFSPMALMSILVVCVVATTVLAGVIFSNVIHEQHNVISESKATELIIPEWSGDMVSNTTYIINCTVIAHADVNFVFNMEIGHIDSDTYVSAYYRYFTDSWSGTFEGTESDVIDSTLNITMGAPGFILTSGETLYIEIELTYSMPGIYDIDYYTTDVSSP